MMNDAYCSNRAVFDRWMSTVMSSLGARRADEKNAKEERRRDERCVTLRCLFVEDSRDPNCCL